MTDARLRSLARDAAQGDPHAHTRLLLERVRVGDLSEERLRLAAYLGDEAASAVVGPDVPSFGGLDAANAVLGLKSYGPAVFVRAAIAAASLLEPIPTEVVDSLQAWLACPCDDHGRGVRGSARRAELGEWDPRHIGAVVLVTRLASAPATRGGGCKVVVNDSGRAVGWLCRGRPRRGRYVTTARDEEEVRAAVVAALLPWALGAAS